MKKSFRESIWIGVESERVLAEDVKVLQFVYLTNWFVKNQ